VLREYGEILVELLKVVPYGMGVGGNDAADRAQKQQRNERNKMSPTYSNGDVDGYTWTATNMPPSLCERVGVTSRTANDALARLAAGAWQANHRHLYVAARSEMQRRGLLEASS
jgi:hypothetical protein